MSNQTSARRKPFRLPPKVHQKGPSLYYVHQNRWHRLCRADAPELTIYRELARVREALEAQPKGELNELFDDFLKVGMTELELSPDTQALYRGAIERQLRKTFGHMRAGSVTPTHVAQFLAHRKKQGRAVSGNRERACLSSVFSWAMSAGRASHNPCLGVKRNREKPKTRYVADQEFLAAFERASEPFQDLMAVALLTGLRQKDLRLLRKHSLSEQGIRLKQSKGGKEILIRWSEPLRYFIKRAVSRTPSSDYIFTNTQGGVWTKNSINAAMRRLGTDWTFHDIRAKAESDHDTGLGLMARYKRAHRLNPVR